MKYGNRHQEGAINVRSIYQYFHEKHQRSLQMGNRFEMIPNADQNNNTCIHKIIIQIYYLIGFQQQNPFVIFA